MEIDDTHSPWAKASLNMYKQHVIYVDQLNSRYTLELPIPEPLSPIGIDTLLQNDRVTAPGGGNWAKGDGLARMHSIHQGIK